MKNALLLLALLVAFTAQARADNAELAQMAKEDQASRLGQEVKRSDGERRTRVIELIAEGSVASPKDKFNAALVLQHTELTLCNGNLASLGPENYLLAHHLAKAALAGGIEDARILVAQTIDRYMTFTVGYQRYGTNRLIDQETGEEYLVPVDRETSDEERATYGVPPLKTLLSRFPERGEPSSPKPTPGGG